MFVALHSCITYELSSVNEADQIVREYVTVMVHYGSCIWNVCGDSMCKELKQALLKRPEQYPHLRPSLYDEAKTILWWSLVKATGASNCQVSELAKESLGRVS